MLEPIWDHIKEITTASSGLFLAEIEPDKPLRFLDIIEDTLFNRCGKQP
ncbi:MAG: hypothetical protein ABSC19_16350 [Syntrophorhabdales bacterium]|jgi:hypothetical protein